MAITRPPGRHRPMPLIASPLARECRCARLAAPWSPRHFYDQDLRLVAQRSPLAEAKGDRSQGTHPRPYNECRQDSTWSKYPPALNSLSSPLPLRMSTLFWGYRLHPNSDRLHPHLAAHTTHGIRFSHPNHHRPESGVSLLLWSIDPDDSACCGRSSASSIHS